jgi:hypothetical protein
MSSGRHPPQGRVQCSLLDTTFSCKGSNLGVENILHQAHHCAATIRADCAGIKSSEASCFAGSPESIRTLLEGPVSQRSGNLQALAMKAMAAATKPPFIARDA